MIVWLAWVMSKLWVTGVAAFQLLSPSWLAVIVQVPTLTRVTAVPATVHTPMVEDAKLTARPEEALALRVTGAFEKVVSEGSNVIVWLAWVMV